MRQEIEAHTLTTHQVDKIGAKCLVVEEQVDSIEVSISFSIEHTRAYSDLGANAPTHTQIWASTHTQIWAPTPLRSGRQRTLRSGRQRTLCMPRPSAAVILCCSSVLLQTFW
jgi:hypothetical protein